MSDQKIWTINKWHELDNYNCLWCKHATTEKWRAQQHFNLSHAAKPPPLPLKPDPPGVTRFGVLVDPKGQPIPLPETPDPVTIDNEEKE